MDYSDIARRGLHQLQARAESTSASSLVWVLIPALISAVVMVLVFIILRRSERRMYMPRTYLGSLRPSERTPASPTGLFSWITAMYKLPDEHVLQHHSMDAYLLLRYLKLITMITFVGCCMTFPVLWPVNATGGGGNQQLDMLNFANVGHQYGRYFAHAFIAWIFVGFIFFTITREYIFYINLRQAYSLSPAYANRLSSRTVLFTTVTPEYLNRDKVRQIFGPEKVRNVWLATDVKKLEELVGERQDAAMKLEAAETKLITMANTNRAKALKKQGNVEGADEAPEAASSDVADDESGSVAARWVKSSDRPTHRLKMLIGKKVDTINWCRSEIERLTPEIEELQEKHRNGDAKLVSSVFVEFYLQSDAQGAYQSVAHNLPLHMSPRYIGLDPTQIVWANLRIKWWERVIRYTVTVAFVIALIVFWAIPTAVVGIISNVKFLTNKVPFLKFLEEIPGWIMGVISGLLPVVAMSILMALVPIIMRLMAKWGGDPSQAAIELTTQNFYFGFQVVQVFLVVTLTSAASSSVTSIIEAPMEAPRLLAKKLPLSANFYISYIILQGLSFSSGALLQIGGLIIGKILGKLLDSTPRKMYTRWSSLAGLGWGTVFPVITLLAVIAITYSCIAPLVMGFATIGLYLFYFAYRYNMLYVSNADIDTQGKVYVRALQQLTVGCYLLVVCLIGLFAIGTAKEQIAVGPLVLMIILLVFMILYHISLNNAMEPLVNYLPKNLEAEEQALLSQEQGKFGSHGDKSNSASEPEADGAADVDSAEKALAQTNITTDTKQSNFLTRYFRPDKYASYAHLRQWAPKADDLPPYTEKIENDAYFHPAITSKAPLLWIPRDPLGVSKQEVAHTSRVIDITDDDAWLDEKNKLHWDMDKGVPPIYEEKVYY